MRSMDEFWLLENLTGALILDLALGTSLTADGAGLAAGFFSLREKK